MGRREEKIKKMKHKTKSYDMILEAKVADGHRRKGTSRSSLYKQLGIMYSGVYVHVVRKAIKKHLADGTMENGSSIQRFRITEKGQEYWKNYKAKQKGAAKKSKPASKKRVPKKRVTPKKQKKKSVSSKKQSAVASPSRRSQRMRNRNAKKASATKKRVSPKKKKRVVKRKTSPKKKRSSPKKKRSSPKKKKRSPKKKASPKRGTRRSTRNRKN